MPSIRRPNSVPILTLIPRHAPTDDATEGPVDEGKPKELYGYKLKARHEPTEGTVEGPADEGKPKELYGY